MKDGANQLTCTGSNTNQLACTGSSHSIVKSDINTEILYNDFSSVGSVDLDEPSQGTDLFGDVELTTQQMLDPTIQEIDKRATNIGYGLGYGLGKFLRGLFSFFGNNADETEETLSNDSNPASLEETLSGYLSNDSLPLEETDTYLDYYEEVKCNEENRCSIINSTTVNTTFNSAIFIEPDIESKTIAAYNDKRILDFMKENQKKGYYVHRFLNVSKAKHVCELIDQVKQLSPLKVIVITGHGNALGIQLGLGNPQDETLNVPNFFKDINYLTQQLSCFSKLDKNTKIVLESCETAKSILWAPSTSTQNPPLAVPLNLPYLLAIHAPANTIYAPTENIKMGSLKIRDHGDSFEVYGILSKFDEHTQIFSIHSQLDAYCHQVPHYYAFRNYCDYHKITPLQNQTQDCLLDEECNQIASFFTRKNDEIREQRCAVNVDKHPISFRPIIEISSDNTSIRLGDIVILVSTAVVLELISRKPKQRSVDANCEGKKNKK